jgi:hypothetical protein
MQDVLDRALEVMPNGVRASGEVVVDVDPRPDEAATGS